MQRKFEINRTKIKGGCQSGRKVVLYNSKSDLPREETVYREGNQEHGNIEDPSGGL